MASRSRNEEVLALLNAAAAAAAAAEGEACVPSPTPSSYLVYAGAQWCPACACAQASTSFLQCFRDATRAVYLSNDVGVEEATAAAQGFPGTVICCTGEAAQELMRHLDITQIPALIRVTQHTNSIKVNKVLLDEEEDGGETAPTSFETGVDQLFRQGVEQHEAGEWAGALQKFALVLQLEPSRAGAAFNLAAILQMVGLTRLAVYYTSRTLALQPDDATAHVLLGTVLAATERKAVVQAYRHLVASTDPPNSRSQHRLAVLTGEGPSAISAAPEYVSQVFDELAASFEVKLVEHLQYRVPWDLFEAVSALRPPPSPASSRGWRVLDLGMGTGLCGKQFQAYCRGPGVEGGAMIGCDLSPNMATKAREGGAYTEVRVQDVHDALRHEAPESLDMVLSADTWIYVGKLDEAFALVACALCAGGIFAFSIEEMLPTTTSAAVPAVDFGLLPSGRYAQSHRYINRLLDAHGFVLRMSKEIVVRNECTMPIPGRIYVAEKEEEGIV